MIFASRSSSLLGCRIRSQRWKMDARLLRWVAWLQLVPAIPIAFEGKESTSSEDWNAESRVLRIQGWAHHSIGSGGPLPPSSTNLCSMLLVNQLDFAWWDTPLLFFLQTGLFRIAVCNCNVDLQTFTCTSVAKRLEQVVLCCFGCDNSRCFQPLPLKLTKEQGPTATVLPSLDAGIICSSLRWQRNRPGMTWDWRYRRMICWNVTRTAWENSENRPSPTLSTYVKHLRLAPGHVSWQENGRTPDGPKMTVKKLCNGNVLKKWYCSFAVYKARPASWTKTCENMCCHVRLHAMFLPLQFSILCLLCLLLASSEILRWTWISRLSQKVVGGWLVFGGIERRVRRAAIAVGSWAKGQLECWQDCYRSCQEINKNGWTWGMVQWQDISLVSWCIMYLYDLHVRGVQLGRFSAMRSERRPCWQVWRQCVWRRSACNGTRLGCAEKKPSRQAFAPQRKPM